ncbi:acetyl-CoA synthetase-like protein [Sistotremastrum niveocremeum HHB9708]|uniref:Acetyl-CoA synthetase-like protein n=1 Tax=Sistotremastrum niveocremeum HHB9708 TaxID=1314777 RepID=A0A164PYW0_9AGAM|nr:acetyl-CoA synthetase-like protein [Sistotremastrum niveocremeum HHB9708]
MSSIFKAPAQVRDQLMSELFIQAGTINLDRVFAQIIEGDVDHPTVEKVSWEQLLTHARAIALELSKEIQPRDLGLPPRSVAILARNGYSYVPHLIAVLMNGWTAMLVSTKNSPAAIDHLLATSASESLLIDQASRSLIQNCNFSIPILEFFDIACLPSHGLPSPKAIASEVLEKEILLPAIYIHTSGSTGHPKIIPWSHQFFSQTVSSYLPEIEGFRDHPLYCLAPICHAMGAIFYLASAPIVGSPIIFAKSRKPITGDALVRHLRSFSDVILAAIPSILQEVAEAGEGAIKELAKRVTVAFFGGAALDPTAGDLLSAHGVPIKTAYGMTEINIGSRLTVPKGPLKNGEWKYLQWRDGFKMHLLPVEGLDARELVVEVHTQGAEDSPAIIDSESPRGFRTKDTWVEHPERPGWWRHAGRMDDITVLSNGEKTNNKQLGEDPRIQHVVVFGKGRAQNGIVVEPAPGTQGPRAFLDEIWPTIVAMNKEVPMHSRLIRELVLVANPGRPFALTDKGTVRAKITLALYEKEIEAAYTNLEESANSKWELPAAFDEGSVQNFLSNVIGDILACEVNESDDLFAQGMDSLLAVRVRSALLPLVKASPMPSLTLPRNIIYTYPTIRSLATFLSANLDPSSEAQTISEHDKVFRTVKKYSQGFVPRSPRDNARKFEPGSVVAVTGTTGSVGSFLVAQLLENPDIRMVYCLNRKSSKDTAERQKEGFKDRGLDLAHFEDMSGRLRFLDVDLSKSDLGLARAEYEDLRDNITHLIHSAWQLNFNMVLESFEKTHVAGVRHLIDLVLSSPRPVCPRFVFLSSISSVSEYSRESEVPEASFSDPSITKMGYGLSKFVGERIIDNAVEKAGLNGTIIRIGQISGGVSGSSAWTKTEQYPIMFMSSVEIGIVPNDLPPVRWIPADVTARVVLSQTFHPDAKPLDYFHLENPDVTPWTDIAEVVATHNGRNLQLVSMEEWLAEIKRRSQEPGFNADKVPAVRLLGFYETEVTMPVLGVEHALEVAPELKFGPIPRSLITKYLEYLHL